MQTYDASFGLSARQAALAAGSGLLVMALLAPFAFFGVLQALIVPGDPEATVANFLAGHGRFRLAIAAFLFVAVLDIVVAWALYCLLKPVNQALALLSAWFRVAYAAILVVATASLVEALQLAQPGPLQQAFPADAVASLAVATLDRFYLLFNLGLGVFGCHLLVLGAVVYRSGHFAGLLGGLVIIAGLGYLGDTLGGVLVPGYGLSLASVTFVGEVWLMAWLLWLGVAVNRIPITTKGHH